MGLALEVGILADLKAHDAEGFAHTKEEFGHVNRVLSQAGLGPHVEPEDIEVFSWGMYGYRGVHYLRRVAAYLALGMPIPPPGDPNAADDPVLHDDYTYALVDDFTGDAGGLLIGGRMKYQHLIMHSDCEGFYVPIDFKGVLIAGKDDPLLGGKLGSTQQLQAECRELASVLGIPAGMGKGGIAGHMPDLGPLIGTDPRDDEVWIAMETQGHGRERWQQYAVETFTCLQLLAACEASLRTKAAIAFC